MNSLEFFLFFSTVLLWRAPPHIIFCSMVFSILHAEIFQRHSTMFYSPVWLVSSPNCFLWVLCIIDHLCFNGISITSWGGASDSCVISSYKRCINPCVNPGSLCSWWDTNILMADSESTLKMPHMSVSQIDIWMKTQRVLYFHSKPLLFGSPHTLVLQCS